MPKVTKKKNKSSRLNFSSTKTRALVIVFAFAVIGAGVMAYKSFAAPYGTRYTAANGGLMNASAGTCATEPASYVEGKASIPVLAVYCRGAGAGVVRIDIAAKPRGPGIYRICTSVKAATSKPINYRLESKFYPLGVGDRPPAVKKVDKTAYPGGYTTACTQSTTVRHAANRLEGWVMFGNQTATMHVNFISIEKVGSASAQDLL